MPIRRFVDAPTASPTVILDLDDDSPLSVLEGISISPPPRRVASFGSSARNGDVLAQKSYPDRTLTIPLQFKQRATAEQHSETIQKLARLLDGEAWLQLQPDGKIEPVFYRTKYGDMAIEDVIVNEKPERYVTLTITAEFAAYGLPVTGTASIANDPTAATNPMSFVFPDVQGDVATPLVMDFEQPLAHEISSLVVASLAAAASLGAPPFFPTSGTAGGAPPGWTLTNTFADGDAIGGVCARLQRASGGTEYEGSVDHPISVDEPGDYRLFVFARGATVDTQTISARQGFGGGPEVIHTASLNTGGGYNWVDLGVFRCPTDYPAVDGILSDSTFGNSDVRFKFTVTNTGTEEIRLSAWVLIPAGIESAASSTFALIQKGGNGTSYPVRLDGISRAVYISPTGPSSNIINGDTRYAGSLPQLVPGMVNEVFVVRPPNAKTETSTADYFYFPRYLYDRPATS